jgi:hypothetical protein
VNALCNAEDATRQVDQPQRPRYCPSQVDQLRAAKLHNSSLKLSLRQLRGDLSGPQKTAVINRLLDVNAAVARSLEWLNGKAEATHDELAALEQLAMEPGTLPGAVGVSQ